MVNKPRTMGDLHRRDHHGWPLFAEEGVHFGDLALLGIDNALGELARVKVSSLAQLCLGHRDSPLMVTDHHL
jgi:hypothetical protein